MYRPLLQQATSVVVAWLAELGKEPGKNFFLDSALCASGCNHSKSTKMEKKNVTRSIFNQIESVFHQILGIEEKLKKTQSIERPVFH